MYVAPEDMKMYRITAKLSYKGDACQCYQEAQINFDVTNLDVTNLPYNERFVYY